jgi:hypothetical protein
LDSRLFNNPLLALIMNLDRRIGQLAYFYVFFPFIVFCLFWLKIVIGLTISILLLFAVYKSLQLADIQNTKQLFLGKQKLILGTIIILFIWVFFSGIGSYTWQNEDHVFRNAIFSDLALNPWPVTYQLHGFAADMPLEGQPTFLVYYMGYWLPSALVAKVCGIAVAKAFLLVWTLGALLLILYYLSKYYSVFSWKIPFLFICWGSLYYLGSMYHLPVKEVLKGNGYLWAGNMLFADGNTGLLYWTFNQTVIAWLIILLIFNKLNNKSIPLLAAMIFFHSPFAFVGLLPFLLYKYIVVLQKAGSIGAFLQKTWDTSIVLAAAVVLVLCYCYYGANSAGSVLRLLGQNLGQYLLFMLLSVGIIVAILWRSSKQKGLLFVSVLVLLLLPFVQLGFGLDFTARVSIPAMFVLMLLAGEVLVKAQNKYSRILVSMYLIVSGLGHNIQLGRSVYFSAIYYAAQTNLASKLQASSSPKAQMWAKLLQANKDPNRLIRNDLPSLASPNNVLVRNFMGSTDSFFYRYLAKK